MQWPQGVEELAQYWLSNPPAQTPLKQPVELAKHRWIVERDYPTRSRIWDWAISRAALGGAFIIMPNFVLQPTDFWWPDEAVFPSTSAGELELRLRPQPTDLLAPGHSQATAGGLSRPRLPGCGRDWRGRFSATFSTVFLRRERFMTQQYQNVNL